MYERFVELLQKYNTTPYKVSQATGISNGSLSDWKSGRSKPKYESLVKIAQYFGVSVDYLLGNEKQNKLPDNADELIDQVLKNKSNMAIVMGKGGDRKVIEVPEDAEAYIRSFIDTFNKKRDK